jgi:hypothetical protein
MGPFVRARSCIRTSDSVHFAMILGLGLEIYCAGGWVDVGSTDKKRGVTKLRDVCKIG